MFKLMAKKVMTPLCPKVPVSGPMNCLFCFVFNVPPTAKVIIMGMGALMRQSQQKSSAFLVC